MTAQRENLTRDEAIERRRVLGDVITSVHLELDADDAAGFGSVTDLTFEIRERAPLFVDLTAAEVSSVELDGHTLTADAVGGTRLTLPTLEPGEHRLRVEARMAYQHEGRGLHRFVDPSDGGVYLHSQFEPFAAHLVYACFDQPDIKSRFTLTVDAPGDWVVVSNGEALETPTAGEAGRWSFATTPLLSPYVTAVVAGPYAHVGDTYERADGSAVPLGLYVRRSLEQYLDPDEILDITRQGLAFFEGVFEQPYPFSTYDQLFVPEFNFGAMENPGCVTFSESYVFRSRVTDAVRERRAETILHEMAHMWFGDLVTMRWWDDLWLNESFATFMAQIAQVDATRWRDAWVTFLDALKAWAKHQDQLPSTHPVADRMDDVESVHQNFDGITYAKGASVLRQLVAWVGQDAFLAGCRTYFADHAWDNAELSDFLSALERASGRDLAEWRDEWLLTTGVNELVPRVTLAPDGTYERVEIEQRSPAPSWSGLPGASSHEPTLRRHRLAVGVYDTTDDGVVRRKRVELDVDGERTVVDELAGVRSGDLLLLNDDDLTYAKVRLDSSSTHTAVTSLRDIADPLARALVWSTAWDMTRDAQLPAHRFVELVDANADAERDPGVVQRLLLRAVGAVERFSDPRRAGERLQRLAARAGAQVEHAEPASDLQLAWARHWADVARADGAHLAAIEALLDGSLDVDGLEVDTDLRWHLLIALARAGVADEARITAELERDPTDLGQRHAATARASRPDPAAKAWAWETLLTDTTLTHTMSRQLWAGFVCMEQVDVLGAYIDQYFDVLDDVWSSRSLEWAIGFAEGMFPHQAAGDQLREKLDGHLGRDLPRPLRRVLLEQRDTLVRTVDARRLDADS